jgi:hypothetical protein
LHDFWESILTHSNSAFILQGATGDSCSRRVKIRLMRANGLVESNGTEAQVDYSKHHLSLFSQFSRKIELAERPGDSTMLTSDLLFVLRQCQARKGPPPPAASRPVPPLSAPISVPGSGEPEDPAGGNSTSPPPGGPPLGADVPEAAPPDGDASDPADPPSGEDDEEGRAGRRRIRRRAPQHASNRRAQALPAGGDDSVDGQQGDGRQVGANETVPQAAAVCAVPDDDGACEVYSIEYLARHWGSFVLVVLVDGEQAAQSPFRPFVFPPPSYPWFNSSSLQVLLLGPLRCLLRLPLAASANCGQLTSGRGAGAHGRLAVRRQAAF